jgi:SRSO17 transposase
MEFCERFGRHFFIRGKDSSGHARHYLSGLLGRVARKNIGRIGENVVASNYQGLQQFISDSPWDHAALMAEIERDAGALLGGHRDSALYLDETSFVKKGEASVGVQRQYCGRLGKLENCQVAVFAGLGRGQRTALIDYRLFLPEAWVQEEERCQRVGVPAAAQVHRTKAELALEMVRSARERAGGRRLWQWIGGDEVYGNNRALTDALEELDETFLMDIASNHTLWDADPCPQLPEAKFGRPPTRTRPSATKARSWKASAWSAAHFEKESRLLTLRETTQGPLRVRLWVREVWQWEPGEARARARLLVVRREADGSYKYSLTNAPAGTAWPRLGLMQSQRYFIERAFEDAKSELGMAHYEVRGWRGWHHHIALCCLALLFTLRERIAHAEAVPLLSVRDIVELLDVYLPRRNRDPAEVLAALHARHTARAAATASARRRARKFITK